MKRVFSNSDQVIHIWAQQSQEDGRSSNVYFQNTRELYSYGRHYPLGLFTINKKGETAVIINTSGYSPTTSGHISGARYATNHYKQFMLPNTNAMKALIEAECYKQPVRITNGLSEAIEYRIKHYYDTLRIDKTKRKAATLEKWKNEVLAECDSYIALLDWYGVKMTAKAKNALAKVSGMNPIEAKEAASKAAIAEDKKRNKLAEQARKERLEKALEAKEIWLKGETMPNHLYHCLRDLDTVYMRIMKYSENDTSCKDAIQTSHGAEFPIEHGKRAFTAIRNCKESNIAWERNGHTIHLGHFQIDSIDCNGNVKAGCHKVEWQEIERIAKQLNIYP